MNEISQELRALWDAMQSESQEQSLIGRKDELETQIGDLQRAGKLYADGMLTIKARRLVQDHTRILGKLLELRK